MQYNAESSRTPISRGRKAWLSGRVNQGNEAAKRFPRQRFVIRAMRTVNRWAVRLKRLFADNCF